MSNRRQFLKNSASIAAIAAAAPLVPASSNPSLQLKKPISTRLLEHSERKVGNCTETATAVEYVGDNGVKHVTDGIIRSIETNEKINCVMTMRTRIFASQGHATPIHSMVETAFVDITKGNIEGDYRWDTIELTALTEDGIYKSPARRVRRCLVNPYAGLSGQDVVENVFNTITSMKLPHGD